MNQTVKIESIMDIGNFSSYEKLIGTTAYVLTFSNELKKKLNRTDEDSRVTEKEEYLRAEVIWINAAQRNRIKKEWKNQFTLYLHEVGSGDVEEDWVIMTCPTILNTQ